MHEPFNNIHMYMYQSILFLPSKCVISFLLYSGIIDDPNDSLFTYGANGGWDSFYSPTFVPQFGIEFTNDTIAKDAEEVSGIINVSVTQLVTVIAVTGLWVG